MVGHVDLRSSNPVQCGPIRPRVGGYGRARSPNRNAFLPKLGPVVAACVAAPGRTFQFPAGAADGRAPGCDFVHTTRLSFGEQNAGRVGVGGRLHASNIARSTYPCPGTQIPNFGGAA